MFTKSSSSHHCIQTIVFSQIPKITCENIPRNIRISPWAVFDYGPDLLGSETRQLLCISLLCIKISMACTIKKLPATLAKGNGIVRHEILINGKALQRKTIEKQNLRERNIESSLVTGFEWEGEEKMKDQSKLHSNNLILQRLQVYIWFFFWHLISKLKICYTVNI